MGSIKTNRLSPVLTVAGCAAGRPYLLYNLEGLPECTSPSQEATTPHQWHLSASGKSLSSLSLYLWRRNLRVLPFQTTSFMTT